MCFLQILPGSLLLPGGGHAHTSSVIDVHRGCTPPAGPQDRNRTSMGVTSTNPSRHGESHRRGRSRLMAVTFDHRPSAPPGHRDLRFRHRPICWRAAMVAHRPTPSGLRRKTG
jgi:hypothetical protein